MTNTFEIEKNKKAFIYTLIICFLFLLIAIFYTWPLQIPAIPVAQDLIEVNLGNEIEGLGSIQPMIKGARAPEAKSLNSNERSVVKDAPSKNIQADENDDPEAAAVTRPVKKNTEVTDIKETSIEPQKSVNPSTAENPTPAPKKPKLPLYKGGTGAGGNNADEDNGYKYQGSTGGNGDAGSPDGKPDSYGNSPGGKSGVSVVKGLSGRRPIHFPSMQDEFNENAKVYVDIKVDGAGIVTSASVAKGTTTSNGLLRNIALQKAKQLKFPTSKDDEEAGTILFNFILKN